MCVVQSSGRVSRYASALLAVAIGVLLTGCGTGTACTACGSSTALGASAAPTFALASGSQTLTIFPGGTVTVPISVNAVGSGTGTVTVTGTSLPQGITVTSVQAPIGGVANLQVSASLDALRASFIGTPQVFSASLPMTFLGSGPGGTSTLDMAVDLELANPAFVPAKHTLPVMQISTANLTPITSKEEYLTGAMTLTDTAGKVTTGTLQIKGHGNSTWLEPKKPYKIKLDDKASLLGMASAKNWILLANYDDKTMLRNELGLKLGPLLGMTWTPSSQFTDLYLNGAYEGTYQLAEQVEINKNRINLDEMDATDISGEALSGAYLGENDQTRDETFTFLSLRGMPVGLDDPDPPTSEQSTYFQNYINTTEASLFLPTFTDSNLGWPGHFDQASLVQYFLAEELIGNFDAGYMNGQYFYKARSDNKLYMGPLWDFDVSSGNVNYNITANDPNQSWVGTQHIWYKQLFNDPAFVAAVKEQWQAHRSEVDTLPDYIAQRGADMAPAAANNYARWPTLNEKIWPNSQVAGGYAQEVTYLQNWLRQRIAYMDTLYGR